MALTLTCEGHMNLTDLPLNELRSRWAEAWGRQPHGTMGRTMMIESIKFKRADGLAPEQQARLDELVRSYKRNPASFDKAIDLKPGAQLVRTWRGQKHCVIVTRGGFDYEGNIYTSLSHIANTITGSRWNGWVFFGLKKAGAS